MASSRQMRRSGLASPVPPPSDRSRAARSHDRRQSYTDGSLDEWDEPPLRTPVPSFEDYRGLERHGVLEHMAPLGTLPNSKVKARMRQHEPPRRPIFAKNGEARLAREDLSTPEPQPTTLPPRRSVPRSEEPQPAPPDASILASIPDPPPNVIVDPVIDPALMPDIIFGPQSSQSLNTSTPTTKSRWKGIVGAACDRANELGNAVLGAAIKQLYEESLHNQGLADLLDAILSQRQSQDQNVQFQVYIKAARKALKKKRTTPSVSQSPASKSLSNGATRQIETSTDLLDPTDKFPPTSIPSPSPSNAPMSTTVTNGSSPRDARPTKRVKRSRSASSDSSLSSLNSDIEDFAPEKLDSELSRASNITAPQLPSLRLDAGPRMGSFSTKVPGDNKASPEEAVAARKRFSRDKEPYYAGLIQPSNIRPALLQPSQPAQPAQNNHQPKALQQRAQQSRRNGITHRNRRHEDDSVGSPASSQGELLLPPPPAPGASRSITPQLGRPPKLAKKAGRIKQSPLKKRNGVVAGLAQSTEAGPSHVGGGRSGDGSPDPEACSACGGGGKTVICDECSRGYHPTCCDPPFAPEIMDDDLPSHWSCWSCTEPTVDEANESTINGLFTELKQLIRAKDPTAFKLPNEIRNYFEGVNTGEEGEYEDLHNVKISKARSGYDEHPDNLKLKDKKENTILCFKCGGSSMGKRELVPCDYCTLCWHLDCLDPPLASAPNKKLSTNKPRQAWMCPNHVDHLLTNVKMSALHHGKSARRHFVPNDSDDYQRTIKTRRPKQAAIVQTAMRRGHRNNGLIEIEEEPSDEESDVERELSGVVFREPERSIKLDFIDRIKRANLETQSYNKRIAPHPGTRRKPQHIQTAKSDVTEAQAQQAELDKRPFKERKAALNLAQLAQHDAELNPDRLTNLIDTLTAEAPIEVEKLLEVDNNTNAAAEPVSEQEKKDLLALIALAQKRLGT